VGVFGDLCREWEKEEMGGGLEERLEAPLGAGTGVTRELLLREEVMTPVR
jgi:hypothetical protein